MTNAPPQPSDQAYECGAFLLREVVMPRYLIRIGQDCAAHRYTERSVMAVLDRDAMTKAHRALLNARNNTLEGKAYDYWTVYQYEREGRRYRHVHTFKMP